MKKIEIEKDVNLNDIVDLLSLNTKANFIYSIEEDGVRCSGPFYLSGRYSTINEVKEFNDVFELDLFAPKEKLDEEEFKVIYTGYDYSVVSDSMVTLFFDVYGIKAEDVPLKEVRFDEFKESIVIEDEEEVEASLDMMEELLEEKDNVVTSYSFIVIKPSDTYEMIADRYNVDVSLLREVNHEKELFEKDLLVLPYNK